MGLRLKFYAIRPEANPPRRRQTGGGTRSSALPPQGRINLSPDIPRGHGPSVSHRFLLIGAGVLPRLCPPAGAPLMCYHYCPRVRGVGGGIDATPTVRIKEPTVLDQIFPPLPLCILMRHAPDQLRGYLGRPKVHFFQGVFVEKPATLYIATLSDLKRQVLIQNPGGGSLGW